MKLITMNELKSWATAGVVLAVAILLTGCATIAAARAEQARWQAMADQATTQLHVAQVYVVPIPGIRGRYTCAERKIELGTDSPEGDIRWLLAHELGHHVHGDCREGILAAEIGADLAAVRVLQALGLSEYDAARDVATRLWRTAKNGVTLGMRGHDACLEMVAVLRAYPAVTNPTDGTCAAQLKAAGG
jgi:hypothetical protein